ncbi:ABC-2 family transporter protein [Candidatus Micrarchaeota archaeon]|nr:ABC-2 family transporter protein [Candidatus Micrarchaeota archaeon]
MAASPPLRKALAIMAVEFSNMRAYGLDFAVSLLSFGAYLVVTFFLWSAVYANSSIEVMPFAVLMSYYLFAFIAADVTGNRKVAHVMSDDVKHGDLTIVLVRPAGYFFGAYFGRMTHFLFFLLVLSVTALVASFFIPVVFQSDALHIALFVLTLFLGFTLNFCLFFALGCIAFWTENNFGIIRSFAHFSHLFSGYMVPLAFFGGMVGTIVSLLPMKYFVSFPVSIMIGRVTLSEVLPNMAIELVWIAALFLAGQFLWRRGMRRYTAPGA